MQFTRRLLQRSLSITLFTRANCSLCEDAKLVVQTVGRKKSFGYSEIDVMAAGQKEWKDCYEFDVPVIHVYQDDTSSKGSQMQSARQEYGKLMHRFSEQQVEGLLDKAADG